MTRTLLLAGLLLPLAACRTMEPEPEPVFIPPPEVRTCFPREELVAEQVPAETKTYTAITMVDNPPYEPIERKETVTREVRPAYTRYRTETGEIVADDKICNDDLVTTPVL